MLKAQLDDDTPYAYQAGRYEAALEALAAAVDRGDDERAQDLVDQMKDRGLLTDPDDAAL